MKKSSGGTRFDGVDRVIAASLALLILAACSNDSTSPTPVPVAIAITSGASQVAKTYTLGPTAGTEDVVATIMNVPTPISTSFTEIGN